jgi:hypothetical protein
MVLHDRTGEHDAEMIGRRGQGRREHGRVVDGDLDAAFDCLAPVAVPRLTQTEHVGEEQQVVAGRVDLRRQ